MGYYINTGTTHDKAQILVDKYEGKIIDPPKKFKDIPEDKALIIVVDNRAFEAAALVYDDMEFKDFTDPTDPRTKIFVLLDKAKAHELAGYKPKA